jgi:threonine/homoserine/homoserine lactone efflux protein
MVFWDHFFQGIAVGVSVAAPIGPMALLCISRTLMGGPLSGFVSGLAAATVDLLYASLGMFGLGAISELLMAQQSWLRLSGAAYLVYLAVLTFRKAPKQDDAAHAICQGRLKMFGSTVVLNLTNPMTIMPFVAIFAGAGLSAGGDKAGVAAMLSGVFIGAALWWLCLSACCNAFRTQMGAGQLRAINRISALALGSFALYAVYGVTIG